VLAILVPFGGSRFLNVQGGEGGTSPVSLHGSARNGEGKSAQGKGGGSNAVQSSCLPSDFQKNERTRVALRKEIDFHQEKREGGKDGNVPCRKNLRRKGEGEGRKNPLNPTCKERQWEKSTCEARRN